MAKQYARIPIHWLLVATIAALCLTLVTSMSVLADTVHIYDDAHVLDQSQILNSAANLSYPLAIYTTKTFTGSTTDFDRRTAGHIGNNLNLIVIAIDTVHHHLAIVGGKNVPLSNDQYNAAVSAFTSNFNGDYTAAALASMQSLQDSLNPTTTNSGDTSGGNTQSSFPGETAPTTGPVPGFDFSPLFLVVPCIFGIIVLGICFAIFTAIRRGGARAGGMGYRQPYGGNPPGQGMNPWAAGGMGAAAGGFLGYELGKEEGEAQARQQAEMGGGAFGGGAGGDFGGGFGGGNIGGGASGDFGGGNIGGGNIGGGSSGNF
jgi:hypothetical protein